MRRIYRCCASPRALLSSALALLFSSVALLFSSCVLLLSGCAMGPVDLTLIDDVRIIAAIAEPPEAAFGEPVQLTAIIANPTDEPVDVLLWQCPVGAPCFLYAAPLVTDEVGGSFLPGGPVSILACRGGRCGDLAETEEEKLRDPYTWLQELPIEGVAAGIKPIALTELPPEERRKNPTITEEPPAPLEEVAPDDAQALSFVVPGVATASGLATAGGFDRISTEVASDGEVTVSWYAPADPGEAQLYVVFDDPFGGTAVWRGDAVVR